MRLMLLGSPGAGKGTQAQYLASHYGIPQIATGDMLRQAQAEKTATGEQLKAIMDAGKLIPDRLIIDIVKDRLAQADCKSGFLLDGFPRTLAQAEALRDAQITLDYVIEINVNDQCVLERLTGRRVHPGSGRSYHIRYCPPKKVDRDDLTDEPLIQRQDDSEETVQKRLDVYRSQTEPLIDYYQTWAKAEPDRAPRYRRIDGCTSIETVREELLSVLDKR